MTSLRSVFLRRVLAYAADCTLLFIVLAPVGWAVQRLLDVAPDTAHTIYAAVLLNFSAPAWVYFAWGDHSPGGATLGKRWLLLQTKTVGGERVGVGRALGRTGVKMLPWETTHAAAFLLAPSLGQFGPASWTGLCFAYAMIFAYLVLAWRTDGRRSAHDFLSGTYVREAAPHRAGA